VAALSASASSELGLSVARALTTAARCVRAQLRITLDGKAPQKEKDVLRRLTASPLVRSVYRVSGEDCFVADVICRRIEDVNGLLLELKGTRALQSSRTAFVLETVLEKGTLGPLPPALFVEDAAEAAAGPKG